MSFSKTTTIDLVREPIDTSAMLLQASRPDCGAVLLFLGTTREWTGTEQTHFLEYDAYDAMARIELQKLADEALNRWPVAAVAIVHRLDRVDISEASVAIVVSAPHRRAAFEAGGWLIDSLKKSVPIWKRDHDATGNTQWLHPKDDSETTSSTRAS